MTVSSTGGASERQPSVMGVYKISNITHSGRPVWQSLVRDDRYLFYHGKTKHLNKELPILIFQGDWLRWVVNPKVSDEPPVIMTKKTGLIYIPVEGWQYEEDGTWQDDDALTVIGT